MTTTAFPDAHVRIVGQPFEIKQVTATVLIVCQCDAKEPLMLLEGLLVRCPACQRGFSLGGLLVGATGHLTAKIGWVPPPFATEQLSGGTVSGPDGFSGES